MLRVNIAVGPADLGWIAGRFARELCERMPNNGVHAEINAGEWGELHYEQIVYGKPLMRPAVGLFTHGEDRCRRFAGEYDGHIGLNTAMTGFLRTAGAPAPVTIEPAVDEQFIRRRPLLFGVCGTTKHDGRKGEALVAKMLDAGYLVKAWGRGWPCEIVSDKLEDVREFYMGLDYYIDTSTDEGGCVPAVECMAMGIPVISHTVGVNRPVLAYERGSWESLHAVLRKLSEPRTYEDWAVEHAEYFKQVANGRG